MTSLAKGAAPTVRASFDVTKLPFKVTVPSTFDVFNALLFFCIANIGFEMGGVFLNAYLPEIAPKSKIGRIINGNFIRSSRYYVYPI